MAATVSRSPARAGLFVWRAGRSRSGALAAAGAGAGVVAGVVATMPSEQVLLLAVDLPRLTPAQRRAAVAFAVEDQIARPLDEVHVIAGARLDAAGAGDGGRWLVAVVGRQALADHLARAPLRDGQRLLPDCLALPVPDAGEWTVACDAGRVLIRLPDSTGLALASAGLADLHRAAGSPVLRLARGGLPPGCDPALPAPGNEPAWPETLDLGSVLRARQPGRIPPGARRIGALALALALAWLALGAVDLVALGRLQADREQALRSILAARGTPVTGDLTAAIGAGLAAAQSPARPRLLPLLSQIFASLSPQTGRVVLRDLQFDGTSAELSLTLEAPDIPTLQQVETQFAAAGFGVIAGAASNADGLAVQQFTLQGAGR